MVVWEIARKKNMVGRVLKQYPAHLLFLLTIGHHEISGQICLIQVCGEIRNGMADKPKGMLNFV